MKHLISIKQDLSSWMWVLLLLPAEHMTLSNLFSLVESFSICKIGITRAPLYGVTVGTQRRYFTLWGEHIVGVHPWILAAFLNLPPATPYHHSYTVWGTFSSACPLIVDMGESLTAFYSQVFIECLLCPGAYWGISTGVDKKANKNREEKNPCM